VHDWHQGLGRRLRGRNTVAAAERQDVEPSKRGSKFACVTLEVMIVFRPDYLYVRAGTPAGGRNRIQIQYKKS